MSDGTERAIPELEMRGYVAIAVSMTILSILVLLSWIAMGILLWHQHQMRKDDLESGTATGNNAIPTGPTPKGPKSQGSSAVPSATNLPRGTQSGNKERPISYIFGKISGSFSKKRPADVNTDIEMADEESRTTIAGPRYITSPMRAVPTPRMAPVTPFAPSAATFHMATPPSSTVTENTNTAPTTARSSYMMTSGFGARVNSPKPASVASGLAPARPERSLPAVTDFVIDQEDNESKGNKKNKDNMNDKEDEDEEDVRTRPPARSMSPV